MLDLFLMLFYSSLIPLLVVYDDLDFVTVFTIDLFLILSKCVVFVTKSKIVRNVLKSYLCLVLISSQRLVQLLYIRSRRFSTFRCFFSCDLSKSSSCCSIDFLKLIFLNEALRFDLLAISFVWSMLRFFFWKLWFIYIKFVFSSSVKNNTELTYFGV